MPRCRRRWPITCQTGLPWFPPHRCPRSAHYGPRCRHAEARGIVSAAALFPIFSARRPACRFSASRPGRTLMLSRLVRIQLIIFSIVSVIGILAITLVYMQVPTLLALAA